MSHETYVVRPDHIWPEVQCKIGKDTENRDNHNFKKGEVKNNRYSTTDTNLLYWSWRPKLQKHFCLKNTNIKMERPTAAMPRKRESQSRNTNKAAQEIASHKVTSGIVFTRRTRISHRKLYFVSMTHCRMLKLQWTSDDGEKKSSRQSQHDNWRKTTVRKRLFSEHKETKVHFVALMDMCFLKSEGLKPKLQKYLSRVVLRGDTAKKKIRSVWNFYWTGVVCVPNDCRKSNACYCKSTWFRRTSSWCNICLHSGKIGDVPGLPEFLNQNECPDVWIRHPPKSWTNVEDPAIFPERKVFLDTQDCCEKDNSTIFLGIRWWKFHCLFIEKQWFFFFGIHGRQKLIWKNQNVAPMWKDLMNNVDLDDLTSFLDHAHLT